MAHYVDNNQLELFVAKFQHSKQEKHRCELIIEDLKKSKIVRLNNEKEMLHDLEGYVKKYNIALKDFNESKEVLIREFLLISERLARKAYNIIADVDDAIQDGAMICFDKIDRFDPERGSKAFNFFSTCILHHFRQSHRSNKNYKLLKTKYRDHILSKMSSTCTKNIKEIFLEG